MSTSDLFDKTAKDPASTPAHRPTSKPMSLPPTQGQSLDEFRFPAIMADAKSGADFKPCPAGTHVACCYQVIDVGTHSGEFAGKKRTRRMVRIVFEVSEEIMESGKPFSLGKSYTLSLNKKSILRAHLESWRGKPFSEQELMGFDVSKLIGVPCLLTVNHTPGKDDPSRVYATIQSVAGLVRGMPKPQLVNPLLCYSVSQGKNHPSFGLLSEWLQKECSECLEWQQAPASMETIPDPADIPDDEPGSSVPF